MFCRSILFSCCCFRRPCAIAARHAIALSASVRFTYWHGNSGGIFRYPEAIGISIHLPGNYCCVRRWCALGGAARLGSFLNSRITLGIALVYIAFSAFIALSWYLPGLSGFVPSWLEE